MSETPSYLAARLKAEGEKAAAFFAALSEDQWQVIVYTENAEWRVRDVLAHFISAEKAFLQLFESIRIGGSGVTEEFSIDRFNNAEVARMRDIPPKELLAEFARTRAAMISYVEVLSEAEIQKEGRHAFLGVTTLAEMVKMVYRHNLIHLREIRTSTPLRPG